MKNRIKRKKSTSEEQLQIKYLDKLEKDMDHELKRNCSKADEWIDRLGGELGRQGYCQEAKLRISWLLYHVMNGAYDGPDNIYTDQE